MDIMYSISASDDPILAVLCADRVSQMTKAYNDIEAVSSLLEEKERDLELAARIGQSLLERNKELESKTSEYEVQLVESHDRLKQLRHDVSQKDALLQMYIHDEDSSPNSPQDDHVDLGVGVVSVSGLQRKVRSLEEENINLIKETAYLQIETELVEEKEHNIFRDCVKQLEDYKNQVLHLQREVITKSDLNLSQQQQITILTEKKVALEQQNKKIQEELSDITKRLHVAQEIQTELATEINELENQNEELEVLVHESHEEVKILKKKQKPSFIRHHSRFNSPFLPEGSLALELEDSIRNDVDCPPGYTARERRIHCKNVMRTAKIVRKASSRPSSASSSLIGSSYHSEAELSEGGYGGDVESLSGSHLALGRPGLPGSNDLDVALKHLSQGHGDQSDTTSYNDQDDIDEPRTSARSPDSLLSLGSLGNISELSHISGASYRIPEKLQIVKPMEGSYTLHNWKRLATPNLGGLLEDRPGIQTKGDVTLDSEQEERYSLSDYEEDDDYSLHLGKCMEATSGIYTYTTAKVLHPHDHFNNTSVSSAPMKMSLGSPSSVVTSSVSYCKLNDHGTSTFSMSAGVAHSLQERSSLPPGGVASIQRYGNIVTETISSATQSQTQVLYTSSGGIVSVGGPVASVVITRSTNAENAYLKLADKVKDIGLNAILGIANKSGIAPVKLNAVDTGLNAIMSIRRNRSGGLVDRGLAEKASQTILYAKSPKFMNRKANIFEANPSRIIMAAPCIAGSFIPGFSSTPRSGKTLDDLQLIRTLPSVVVTSSIQDNPPQIQKSPQRPTTLSLGTMDQELADICVRNRISVNHEDPAVCDTETSGGLLKHLTSIYTKTRGIIGAPAAALGHKSDS